MRAVQANGLIRDALFVRAHFTSPLFGAQPTGSIAADFVRQKAIERLADELVRHHGYTKTKAKKEAEARVRESSDMTDEESDEASVQITVFHRDDIGPHLMDYQIQGAFYEAVKQLDLRVPPKTKAAGPVMATSSLRGGLWIFPTKVEHERRLYLYRDGVPLEDIDRVVDRPKRVMLPTGQEATSIAVSEVIDPPAHIEFVVALLHGCRYTMEQMEQCLAYLSFQGIGQWRNAGHGRVMCEVDDLDPGRVAVAAGTMMRMAMVA